MAELSPGKASFLLMVYITCDGGRESFFEKLSGWRDKEDTDEGLYGVVDEFLGNQLHYTEMAYQYRLAQKDEKIKELENPVKEKAFSNASSDDVTYKMIEKLEESLALTVEKYIDQFKKIDGLTRVSIDFYPEHFGAIIFNARSKILTKKDANYYVPQRWDHADLLHSQDNEMPALKWFQEYMDDTKEKLYEEEEDTDGRWDQWLRTCMAMAIMGDRFQSVFIDNSLFYTYSYKPDPSDIMEKFYIGPGEESEMSFTSLNFVEHLFALKYALGELSTEAINNLYEGAIIPFK